MNAGARLIFDGVERSPDEPLLSPLEGAVLWGRGVFEIAIARNGKVFALDAHLARLAVAAKRIGLAVDPTIGALREETCALAQGSGEGSRAFRFAYVAAGRPPSGPRRRAGPPIASWSARRSRPHLFFVRACAIDAARALPSGMKTTSYLPNLLASDLAHARGVEEAILLGPHGEVIEAAHGNVLARFGSALHTPRLSSGALPGVTRAFVRAQTRQIGLNFVENLIFPSDLERADEILITSSLRGIASVTHVDGVAIGGETPVGDALREAYRRAVETGPGPTPQEVLGT